MIFFDLFCLTDNAGSKFCPAGCEYIKNAIARKSVQSYSRFSLIFSSRFFINFDIVAALISYEDEQSKEAEAVAKLVLHCFYTIIFIYNFHRLSVFGYPYQVLN